MENYTEAFVCSGSLMVFLVLFVVSFVVYSADRTRHEKQLREQQEAIQRKKQQEFQIWYNSLTTEEKTLYQLERQNKLLEEQGRTGRAIAGMVATHNMFDTLHRH